MKREDYAVIETGGKQYRVSPGDTIRVERLPAGEQERIEFERVLMVRSGGEVMIGSPTVEGATVVANLVSHGKGKKVTVFKYKPKVNYRRLRGHRQPFSEVLIENIEMPETS